MSLDEFGAVQHEIVSPPGFAGERFTVVAARGGDDMWVEVRRRKVGVADGGPRSVLRARRAAARDCCDGPPRRRGRKPQAVGRDATAFHRRGADQPRRHGAGADAGVGDGLAGRSAIDTSESPPDAAGSNRRSPWPGLLRPLSCRCHGIPRDPTAPLRRRPRDCRALDRLATEGRDSRRVDVVPVLERAALGARGRRSADARGRAVTRSA